MGRGAASPRHQCEGLTVARSQNPRQDFSTGKDPWRFCHPLKLSPARSAGQRRRGAAGDLCPRAAQPRGTGAAIGPQPVIFGEHHRRAHDQWSRPGGRGGDAESDPGWTTWDPSGTRSGGRLFCRSRDRRGAHHRASHRPSRRCDRLSSRPVRWPVRASHRSGRPGRRVSRSAGFPPKNSSDARALACRLRPRWTVRGGFGLHRFSAGRTSISPRLRAQRCLSTCRRWLRTMPTHSP